MIIYYQAGGEKVCFRYLADMFEEDEKLAAGSGIRIVPRLTKKLIEPTPFELMNVSNAARVRSNFI